MSGWPPWGVVGALRQGVVVGAPVFKVRAAFRHSHLVSDYADSLSVEKEKEKEQHRITIDLAHSYQINLLAACRRREMEISFNLHNNNMSSCLDPLTCIIYFICAGKRRGGCGRHDCGQYGSRGMD